MEYKQQFSKTEEKNINLTPKELDIGLQQLDNNKSNDIIETIIDRRERLRKNILKNFELCFMRKKSGSNYIIDDENLSDGDYEILKSTIKDCEFISRRVKGKIKKFTKILEETKTLIKERELEQKQKNIVLFETERYEKKIEKLNKKIDKNCYKIMEIEDSILLNKELGKKIIKNRSLKSILRCFMRFNKVLTYKEEAEVQTTEINNSKHNDAIVNHMQINVCQNTGNPVEQNNNSVDSDNYGSKQDDGDKGQNPDVEQNDYSDNIEEEEYDEEEERQNNINLSNVSELFESEFKELKTLYDCNSNFNGQDTSQSSEYEYVYD